TFWLKTVAVALAAILYVGVCTYFNFFAVADDTNTTEYMFVVDDANGEIGLLSFSIGSGDGEASFGDGGAGTADDPYIVNSITGAWDVPTDTNGAKYFRFKTDAAKTYTVNGPENLSLKIYYVLAGKMYALYDYQIDGDTFTLSLEQPEGYGNTVGDICYDFTLDCYNDRESVTLSELRGKIVVVNFWGTWCGPCVQELPDFEKVRAANAEDVEMIAIHSKYLSSTAQNGINEMGWSEWGIIFAQDTGTDQKSDIFTMLGGRSGAYPRTLVIDANGVISSVFDGSVDEETLTKAIESARAD
ncbi:MAG: TlpA family protein disulfide reductase, partial [Clostridiales bacterium]|nr:TlpA family protein disulfide reductase [Clostridiales bacterium]